jgi:hypothetical protein
MYKWDVFISHASEDKETVARPLAQCLERSGLRVWYDPESPFWAPIPGNCIAPETDCKAERTLAP